MYSPFLSELVEARYAARLAEAERRRQRRLAGGGHSRHWVELLGRTVMTRTRRARRASTTATARWAR
jgi:hypothetical protein